ncbi:MAG: peptidase S11 [Methylococcaceae bacterium]|nr:peptidase S11 [Methylococcaceae bacterium]
MKSLPSILVFIVYAFFQVVFSSTAWAAENSLFLKSSAAIVMDQATGAVLFEKNSHLQLPIASITKLMTAMVILDSKPFLDRPLVITEEDVDMLRRSSSRLPVGTVLTVEEMLRLALMASENRAASALARSFPGGRFAFISAMNLKARSLGLRYTRFLDATGLNSSNVSSPRDLSKMVATAAKYPLISAMTTTASYEQMVGNRWVTFRNTNALVRDDAWRIDVSKTGYINESGKCLVMQTRLNDRPTIIVLLDALGRHTPIGDSNRIKEWIDSGSYREGLYTAAARM